MKSLANPKNVLIIIGIIGIAVILIEKGIFLSKEQKLSKVIYSFKVPSFPILFKTKELLSVQPEIKWNVCKPEIFLLKNIRVHESIQEGRISFYLRGILRLSASTQENINYLKKTPSITLKLKEELQNKIEEYGLCIQKLKITSS